MKKIKYKISYSLLSMFLAWVFGYLCYVIYQLYLLNKSRIEEGLVIFSWSAIFCFFSSIVVVPVIVWTTNKYKKSQLFFVLLTLLSSFLVILLLPFLLFQFYPWNIGLYVYIHTLIVSIIFSLIYLRFNTKE